VLPGQAEPVEQIIVTGSRIISDASKSPTPVMVFWVDQLHATTPTNIADALNKLPVFQGSSGPRTQGNAGSNGAGNVLNLRNFGQQRTLVLLDGHRVPATSAAGTVDIDTLPQMLMTRVDVVTGSASAVYGSDAVAGVVNFILDKNFDGVKYETNGGVSDYGDAASYQMGVAAGTDRFSGRGHIEGSLQEFHQDGLLMSQRPLGAQAWGAYGIGTAFNATPPVYSGTPANPGFTYPGLPGEDVIGRYFTIGVRGNF
jgi:outer membrane cobalamin receptor